MFLVSDSLELVTSTTIVRSLEITRSYEGKEAILIYITKVNVIHNFF